MIWVKDVWFYFLDEDDIAKAFYDYHIEGVVFEKSDFCIEIPRCFTRAGLLRSFIKCSNDKKLRQLAENLSDDRLCDLYHGNYSCNYEPDNYYSQWIPFGKKIIFDYAEEWCFLNNIKCTVKENNKYDKYIYLDCL